MKTIDNEIQYLKGVGPKMSLKFKKLGINTIEDLFYYPPIRYINRKIKEEINFHDGDYITINGFVKDTGYLYTRNRKFIFNALIEYNGDYLYAKWFNNTYIKNTIKEGQNIIISGKVSLKRGVPEILHPEYEIFDKEDMELIHTGRIVPIYSLKSLMYQKYIRKIIFNALDKYGKYIIEDLPFGIIKKYNFLNIENTIKNLHFPENEDILIKSLKRLKYYELFYAGIILAMRKQMRKIEKGYTYKEKSQLVKKLLNTLNFELTNDQKNALNEILKDMKSKYPMNRLLMGDVGVGKTIIALLSVLYAVESGYQTAIMAPTEVLAQQHYIKIKNLLKDLDIKISLLTSSIKKKDRNLKGIENGEIHIIIGTHALIQENIKFKNLRLIVIDEQHRFGVVQRNLLKSKGINPDLLIMTATPIPRSLSMVMYGDLDVSTIKERPSMQKPIKTKWVSPSSENKMYDFIKTLLDKGEKAFVVCPLIENEESELESVEKVYKKLKNGVFKNYSIGKIYSKLKQNEKDEIMQKMKNGEIQILVGTTVIEVGIDIKDATSIIIMNAERFGLSQLHQLRGRVGRGELQSYCFLLSSDNISEEGIARLKTIVNSNDGFEISEVDLKLRGPGELWGKKQHGLPEFKFCDFAKDYKIMKYAFEDAKNIIDIDKNLLKIDNKCIKDILHRRYKDEIKEF